MLVKTKNNKKLAVLLVVVSVVLVAVVVWTIVNTSADPETDQKNAQQNSQNQNQDQPSDPGYTQAPSYVGLTEGQAVQKAEDANVTYRIVSRDGESFPITLDLRQDRLNFTLENGKVTKAEYY